jgi:hypothetical protein
MKTLKKNIAETISGNHEKPEIHYDNKKFVRAVAKANEAFKIWKWVDRNDIELNKILREIREEYNKLK